MRERLWEGVDLRPLLSLPGGLHGPRQHLQPQIGFPPLQEYMNPVQGHVQNWSQ
jgi:hypothetical protein